MMKVISGDKGFTLLEIVAVLVILSVLASVVIPRYIDIDKTTRQRAIDAGVAELNGRETLTWSNLKIANTGYQDDANLFTMLDTTLGNDYSWVGGPPNASGGTLRFKDDTEVTLTRTQSSDVRPRISQWKCPHDKDSGKFRGDRAYEGGCRHLWLWLYFWRGLPN